MGYIIRAYYSDGDSENTYDIDRELTPVWKDLDKAREALKVLNEHHLYYDAIDNNRWRDTKHQLDISDLKTKSWYTETKFRDWGAAANIPLDNGMLMKIDIPYHGWPGHLKKLAIENEPEVEDNSLSFTY